MEWRLTSLAAAGAACVPYTTRVGWLPAMEWRWSSSCHAWFAAGPGTSMLVKGLGFP